jgi:uncharacterized repeat protein (TIGR04138 family)
LSRKEGPDWDSIRRRAERFPGPAFQFVREGLAHTVTILHGPEGHKARPDQPRDVSGKDLCFGLRDMALERYGQLATTVLRRWNIRTTDDFGVIVYAMIDRGELRNSREDKLEDFQSVFDFEEAFAPAAAHTPRLCKRT